MPVKELLARTTSAELTEWMAYYGLMKEPAGEQRQVIGAGDIKKMFAKRVVKNKATK